MKTKTAATLVGLQIKNQQLAAAEFRLLRAMVKAQSAIARIIVDFTLSFKVDLDFIVGAIIRFEDLVDVPTLDGEKVLDSISDLLEGSEQTLTDKAVSDLFDNVLEPVVAAAKHLSRLSSRT